MLTLAAHILDITENSIRAGAKLVEIIIEEDTQANLLTIEINDDGRGMNNEILSRIFDPFYTTKTVRRVGLGLPLLKYAAERAGGALIVNSKENQGTRIKATFELSHLDRQPLGDIKNTLIILIIANIHIDFFYKHRHNDRRFELDTREIRKEIEDVPINHPEIIKFIRGVIDEGLGQIGSDA